MKVVYSWIAILSTLLASISFAGFWVSASTWDVESAGISGVMFMFFVSDCDHG